MSNNFIDFVKNQVSEANNNLLPIKSKDAYQDVWTKYEKFCSEKEIEDIRNINSVYAYLNWMHTEKEWNSPSTLWNKYSIIKSMVFNKFALNFDEDPIEKQITLWIKNKQSRFMTKQSEMFTKTQVSNFLESAKFDFIQTKIVLIIGCFTGLRTESIAKLAWKNIVIQNNDIKIYIDFETKTDRRGEGMWFLLPRDFGGKNIIVTIFLNYINFLSEKNKKFIDSKERIFPRIDFRNDSSIVYKKAFRGKSWIGEVPKNVAIWLKIEDSNLFTGHCLRRTCAQWLADSGMAEVEIMHFFGWKNCNMVKIYTKNSTSTKEKAAKGLSFEKTSPSIQETEVETEKDASEKTTKKKEVIKNQNNFIHKKNKNKSKIITQEQKPKKTIETIINKSNVMVFNSANVDKEFFNRICFFYKKSKKNKRKAQKKQSRKNI